MNEPHAPLRLLFIEDIPFEVDLAFHQLRRDGLHCEWRRVETEPQLRAALTDFAPDVILSDFSLPQYDGLSALRVAQEMAAEVPFIFLSGSIGETRAIEAMRSGATDYIVKGDLKRLAPAIRRALDEVGLRSKPRR